MSEESVLQLKLTERKGVLGQSFVGALARAMALYRRTAGNVAKIPLDGRACAVGMQRALANNAQSGQY